MTVVTKLDKFFDEELRSEVRDILITCDRDGQYNLFGEYRILPKNGQFIVRSKSTIEVFATIKNALAFVTLHHAGKYRDARRIQQLDLRLCSINVDLAIHRNILKTKNDTESRLIYIIKIQEDTIKKRRIVDEIKSYINSSIRIQTGKFSTASHTNFTRK